ncbi:MAG: hypothetical protein ACQETE_03425 [Bacteroidota bacterium]
MSSTTIRPPFYPIIYVRGYAMRPADIKATTETPYMGFNLGSTKIRQRWNKSVTRHVFESPLIRLMKEYGYQDVYNDGKTLDGDISSRSIIIHRYYDEADEHFGSGEVPTVPEAAEGLGKLILKVREKLCGQDPELQKQFKVYLVAHSMGGLICRTLLQNDQLDQEEARQLVDKVFTYGTPHNGIDLRGMHVPEFLGIWDMNNFNRSNMADYLDLDSDVRRVDTLDGKFDPKKFFCLVGTNHRDYSAAKYAVGPMSDGLVKIKNATVQGAPRAFTNHSHSGSFGLVNSENGYQNLVRFLFGDRRVMGILEPEELPLPPTVQHAYEAGQKVRASYFFEVTVQPRGALSFTLHQRTTDTQSAIIRTFDELFPDGQQQNQEMPDKSPVLFSTFLDTRKIRSGRTLVFTVDLVVRTTEYEIDGVLFMDKRIPEENLFRDNITIRATETNGSWNIRYLLSDEEWGEKRGKDLKVDEQGLYIPLKSKKGFRAKLRLDISRWNDAADAAK